MKNIIFLLLLVAFSAVNTVNAQTDNVTGFDDPNFDDKVYNCIAYYVPELRDPSFLERVRNNETVPEFTDKAFIQRLNQTGLYCYGEQLKQMFMEGLEKSFNEIK